MNRNKKFPVFDSGNAVIYKVNDTGRKGVLSNPTLSDMTKLYSMPYGDATVSYKDSEITGGHDIADTVKVKIGDNFNVTAGMYAVITDFRTGKTEFCRIYAADPNHSAGTLFLYMEEVRHGGY